jgi:hypothetical protein
MGPRKPFLLRIDPALWADLEAWAQAELRSVNGQVEYLIKQALQKRKGATPRAAPPPADAAGAPDAGQGGSGG